MYVYAAAMADALAGRGEFWPADGRPATFSNEQEFAAFAAIRDAMRDASLSDAQRWQRVMGAVCVEAAKFAEYTAEKTQ